MDVVMQNLREKIRERTMSERSYHGATPRSSFGHKGLTTTATYLFFLWIITSSLTTSVWFIK